MKARKTKSLDNILIPKGRSLYFNDSTHSYKDEFDNKYTSVTTVIHKYVNEFKEKEVAAMCERIGRNPRHPKYLRYKNKSVKQILCEWEIERNRACTEGTAKHNYLEDIIKSSSNYKAISNSTDYVKLYTVDDIISNHNFGRIKLSHRKIKDLAVKYPKIYNVIKSLVEQGYNIYSEVAVYDGQRLISGLIDILAVKGDEFIIVDWKTNKAPIRFEAGYYLKDDYNQLTDVFKETFAIMKYPLDDLADSVGNHYALQLSLYAYLVESFGFKFAGLMLMHIRTTGEAIDNKGDMCKTEVVELLNMPYLKSNIENMLLHHSKSSSNTPTLF